MKGVMVGAGFFAAYQADGWSRIPGVTIAAVADLNRDRASQFAARWSIPAVYTDAAGMLERERPDFVDIVTGPDTHLPLVEMAARAGVHVICQKPMAPTFKECLAMVETCERARVRLMVHENWRWQPWYREGRRLLDAGTLGRLFHLGFLMRNGDGRGPNPYTAQPYFRTMERFLLQETMVHFLDTFRYLGGEIRSLYCQTARINPVIRGEDYVLIQIAFEGGAHGVIDANRISGPFPLEPAFGTLRVEGEQAMLRMDPHGRLFLTRYGEPETPHEYDIPASGYRGDSVKAVQEHILECLRTGRRAESEGRGYLATVRAVEACYRSAHSGQAVALREVAP